MSVEFNVGEKFGVSPPTETERTIYADLVNLPDPIKIGLTVKVYNYDSVTLYMKLSGTGTGWTFTATQLGSLAAGSNYTKNIDQFGSKAKPAAETSETVIITLNAYTDAGYSVLKWTYSKNIDLLLIKSDDGSWTQDELDNFDDGTVQGWTAVRDGGDASIVVTYGVRTDYVLSPAYSFGLSVSRAVAGNYEARARMSKTFNTTALRNTIYAIINVRPPDLVYAESKYEQVQNGDTVLVFVGQPYDTVDADYLPVNRWIRIVVPLPKNTAVDFRIIHDLLYSASGAGWVWNMDDFRIVSK